MKLRLDQIIYDRRLTDSRAKAKALIMEGKVFVNGICANKAGDMVDPDLPIEIKAGLPYVSRGGQKLEKILEKGFLKCRGFVCLDIGASTGGFTDCLLQNAAEKVYAVDVGYGQLAWKLRNDPRVVLLERTNARNLTFKEISEKIDLITMDVSFISLTKLLPVAFTFLKESGHLILLIKPQFEAEKNDVGKKGVIHDPKIHQKVIEKIYDFCRQNNYTVIDLDFSPIKGPKGNIEFLMLVSKQESASFPFEQIQMIVRRAHRELS